MQTAKTGRFYAQKVVFYWILGTFVKKDLQFFK